MSELLPGYVPPVNADFEIRLADIRRDIRWFLENYPTAELTKPQRDAVLVLVRSGAKRVTIRYAGGPALTITEDDYKSAMRVEIDLPTRGGGVIGDDGSDQV